MKINYRIRWKSVLALVAIVGITLSGKGYAEEPKNPPGVVIEPLSSPSFSRHERALRQAQLEKEAQERKDRARISEVVNEEVLGKLVEIAQNVILVGPAPLSDIRDIIQRAYKDLSKTAAKDFKFILPPLTQGQIETIIKVAAARALQKTVVNDERGPSIIIQPFKPSSPTPTPPAVKPVATPKPQPNATPNQPKVSGLGGGAGNDNDTPLSGPGDGNNESSVLAGGPSANENEGAGGGTGGGSGDNSSSSNGGDSGSSGNGGTTRVVDSNGNFLGGHFNPNAKGDTIIVRPPPKDNDDSKTNNDDKNENDNSGNAGEIASGAEANIASTDTKTHSGSGVDKSSAVQRNLDGFNRAASIRGTASKIGVVNPNLGGVVDKGENQQSITLADKQRVGSIVIDSATDTNTSLPAGAIIPISTSSTGGSGGTINTSNVTRPLDEGGTGNVGIRAEVIGSNQPLTPVPTPSTSPVSTKGSFLDRIQDAAKIAVFPKTLCVPSPTSSTCPLGLVTLDTSDAEYACVAPECPTNLDGQQIVCTLPEDALAKLKDKTTGAVQTQTDGTLVTVLSEKPDSGLCQSGYHFGSGSVTSSTHFSYSCIADQPENICVTSAQ